MPTKVKSKKQIIYEEAAKLFQEKGYSAASMRDLAERVNLKASSLYSHIRKKEEILHRICFENAARFTEGMETVLHQPISPLEKVKTLIRLHIRVALEDPTSITVFNDEWRHLEEPFLGEFLELRRQYEQHFKEIIQEGIREGTFKPLDPTIVLLTLINSLRWLHYWHRPAHQMEPQTLEAQLLHLLLDGMVQ